MAEHHLTVVICTLEVVVVAQEPQVLTLRFGLQETVVQVWHPFLLEVL
jgi:hypothetical protein